MDLSPGTRTRPWTRRAGETVATRVVDIVVDLTSRGCGLTHTYRVAYIFGGGCRPEISTTSFPAHDAQRSPGRPPRVYQRLRDARLRSRGQRPPGGQRRLRRGLAALGLRRHPVVGA